jgi:hypothetical protein
VTAGIVSSQSARPTALINPSAKASIFARHDTGVIVLGYSPSSTLRSPLALAESKSGAVDSFKHLVTLTDNSSKSFAYPTSVMVGSKIHTVYSVYNPHATAPHVHHWWGIRIATVDVRARQPLKLKLDDDLVVPRRRFVATMLPSAGSPGDSLVVKAATEVAGVLRWREAGHAF